MSDGPKIAGKSDKKASWTLGEKWLLGVISVGLIGGLGTWAGLKSLERMPELNIPTRSEPSPNGYVYLVAAGRVAVEGPSINARPVWTGTSESKQWLIASPTSAVVTADRPASKKNSSALSLLKKGLQLPVMMPQWSGQATNLVGFRHIARATRDTAIVLAADRRYAEAMDISVDSLDFGERITKGSDIIGLLVSIACQAISRRTIWPMVDHLDAKTAREAAQRIASIDARATPIGDSLEEEKWSEERALIMAFQKKTWRADLLSDSNFNSGVDAAEVRALAFVSKRALLNAYDKHMDDMIAITRGQFNANINPPDSGIKYVDRDLSMLNGEMWFKWCQKAADNRLLATTLALRAFHLDYGAYPASLEALVPKYLPSVPQDPLSAGPLKYKVAGSSYTLYSIGPDGVDDGGKPIDSSAKSFNHYRADFNSRGDIVAGINE